MLRCLGGPPPHAMKISYQITMLKFSRSLSGSLVFLVTASHPMAFPAACLCGVRVFCLRAQVCCAIDDLFQGQLTCAWWLSSSDLCHRGATLGSSFKSCNCSATVVLVHLHPLERFDINDQRRKSDIVHSPPLRRHYGETCLHCAL